MPLLTYRCVSFAGLTPTELYAVLQLRQAVFVVEQNCPYLDADDKDQVSYHVLGEATDGTLHAYTRLVPRGVSYPTYPSIGRVLTSARVRGRGEGYRLMRFSIERCEQLFGKAALKISAQQHLQKFYAKLGFVATGEAYLEDGIPHVGMVRPPLPPLPTLQGG